jgi:hypothetical protein
MADRSASRPTLPWVGPCGAFYYRLARWPSTEGKGRGLWLPVDPTLNQFPADATHVRLARGGLDQQAVILPLIGRLKMTIIDLDLVPGADRVIVGRQPEPVEAAMPLIDLPRAASSGCRCPSAGDSAKADRSTP